MFQTVDGRVRSRYQSIKIGCLCYENKLHLRLIFSLNIDVLPCGLVDERLDLSFQLELQRLIGLYLISI